MSSSAPGLSVMTPGECLVDCPFPSHVTRCWVRTVPPRSMGMDRLFNSHFLGLTLRYRNAVAWTCDQPSWYSSPTSTLTSPFPSATTTSIFLNCVAFTRVLILPFHKDAFSSPLLQKITLCKYCTVTLQPSSIDTRDYLCCSQLFTTSCSYLISIQFIVVLYCLIGHCLILELYSRYFDPFKHQPSPSMSINIIYQTAPSLSQYRSKRPITTIDIEGIYGTNILQTGLAEGKTTTLLTKEFNPSAAAIQRNLPFLLK